LFDGGGSGREVDELTSDGDGEELGEDDDDLGWWSSWRMRTVTSPSDGWDKISNLHQPKKIF
jgi:hypothetical protein